MVYVAGMTIEEARAAIEKQLAQELVDPKVVVDVFAYNSKKYYVITRNGGQGDQVTQAPLSGNETVLDAVAGIGGLSQLATKKLWISRPSQTGAGTGLDTILPINWEDIASGKSLATNYELMPGDRLFIVNAADVAEAKPGSHRRLMRRICPITTTRSAIRWKRLRQPSQIW